MQSELYTNLTRLVEGSHTSEAALRTVLLNTLMLLGFNADIERNGADIVVLDRRIVIETKLKAGPSLRGRRNNETQYDQLQRYIESMQDGDDQLLLFDSNSRQDWRGVLTKGRAWWAWDWQPDGTGDIVHGAEQMVFRHGEQIELEGWLRRLLNRKRLA